MWSVISSGDRLPGTSSRAGAGLPALVLLAALLSLSGCRQYHYVVSRDGAALFSDESRAEVIGHMKRYHHGALGFLRPGDGLVEVEYEGRHGVADVSDLRIFSYPNPRFSDSSQRDEAIRRNIREVILEVSGWSDVVKAAVRADRILRGFTREQVELAWGLPRTMVPAEDGGERWVYRFRRYRARDEVYVHLYQPSRAGFSYWNGSGWAFDFVFPAHSATLRRHYFPVTLEREVHIDRAGYVVGWEGHDHR